MITVRNLMKSKGDDEIVSVSSNATVQEALKVMAEANTGAVIVKEAGQMVGIFTERDYARKVVLQEKHCTATRIQEIMTTAMITIHPEQSLEECMELMTNNRIRHLPVMENGRLVGMISMGDVVKMILEYKDSTIRSLEDFILGEGYAK